MGLTATGLCQGQAWAKQPDSPACRAFSDSRGSPVVLLRNNNNERLRLDAVMKPKIEDEQIVRAVKILEYIQPVDQ